jgi:hypothetical protein
MFVFVQRILKIGVMPVGPNTMYFMFSSCQPYDFWLTGTRSIQEKCDIVFFVPGWDKSNGAKLEYEHAITRNQPVFTSLQHLKNFVEKSLIENTESVT